MRAEAEKAFLKAEDLFANYQARPENLRNAILRYQIAVEFYEQFDPPPKELNIASKHLKEAEGILKKMIKEQQSQVLSESDGTDYLNLPIFFNGGGYNGSDVILSESLSSLFDDTFSLDPYLYSLDLKQDPVDDFNTSPIGKYQAMKIAMLRAASNITGFHPYRFTPLDASQRKWLGQAPSLSELQGRA